MLLVSSIMAQTDTTKVIDTTKVVVVSGGKSSTRSALCDAQDLISNYLVAEGFHGKGTLDIEKEYDRLIIPILLQCVANDIYGWGDITEANASVGKFKKTPLTFEKPEENSYTVPPKAIRQYKRVIESVKKEYFSKRKKLTVSEILSEKNLKSRLKPVAKTLKNQFLDGIKKASK